MNENETLSPEVDIEESSQDPEETEESNETEESGEEIGEESGEVETDQEEDPEEGETVETGNVEEILSEISGRLENLEEVICATPDPDSTFLDQRVSALTVTDGLLVMILMVLLFALLKDWIGGILESCIRR